MQQHAETMFFGQGDHLIQANPSNEFYALLFRETKTSNADDAAVFLASFTSTESSCVKNLRHDFFEIIHGNGRISIEVKYVLIFEALFLEMVFDEISTESI